MWSYPKQAVDLVHSLTLSVYSSSNMAFLIPKALIFPLDLSSDKLAAAGQAGRAQFNPLLRAVGVVYACIWHAHSDFGQLPIARKHLFQLFPPIFLVNQPRAKIVHFVTNVHLAIVLSAVVQQSFGLNCACFEYIFSVIVLPSTHQTNIVRQKTKQCSVCQCIHVMIVLWRQP